MLGFAALHLTVPIWKNGGGRSPERTGLSPVFPVNREKTGKIRNFWLNLGDLGDFCAISVSVYSELEGISLLS